MLIVDACTISLVQACTMIIVHTYTMLIVHACPEIIVHACTMILVHVACSTGLMSGAIQVGGSWGRSPFRKAGGVGGEGLDCCLFGG